MSDDRKERPARFTTVSDMPIEPLYGPASLPPGFSYAEKLGDPGEYPYTRGIHPTMYRGRLWTMRQFAGFGSAEDTNARFHYLLGQGQTGLTVAFDLPTLMGRDSDDAMARGEVGKEGVAVDTLAVARPRVDAGAESSSDERARADRGARAGRRGRLDRRGSRLARR